MHAAAQAPEPALTTPARQRHAPDRQAPTLVDNSGTSCGDNGGVLLVAVDTQDEDSGRPPLKAAGQVLHVVTKTRRTPASSIAATASLPVERSPTGNGCQIRSQVTVGDLLGD